MNSNDFVKLLQEIEKNIDIQKFEYQEIAFWPIIRFMLYTEHSSRNGGLTTEAEISKKQKLLLLCKMIFSRFVDYRQHKSLKNADVYFLTMSNSRVFIDSKGYVDSFISPLVEWSKYPCHIDEMVFNGEFRYPRAEKTVYIQKEIYLQYIKATLLNKLNPQTYEWQDTWETIREFLSKHGYQTSVTTNHIATRLLRFFFLKTWFDKRLAIVKPKQVVVVCYYSLPCLALICAANQRGINTIDLQHGVQGQSHIAYSNFYNIPHQGWSMLPKQFWNWNYKDKENIDSWGKNNHTGVTGGIIWNHYLLANKPLRTSWIKKLNNINKDNKPIILVSLQPSKDNDTFFQQLIKSSQSKMGKKYLWCLRLHPGMMNQKDYLNNLFDFDNCEVDIASTIPLAYLLENSFGHITRYSSVVLEAEYFGVKSIVESGRDYYDNVDYFSNTDNLVIKLNEKQQIDISKDVVNSMNVWQNLL